MRRRAPAPARRAPSLRPCRGRARRRPAAGARPARTIRTRSSSWAITSMPFSSSTARSPTAMIGARSPSMTRSPSASSTGLASRTGRAAIGAIGQPRDAHSVTSCSRASRSRRRSPGTRALGLGLPRRRAVRATTRCEPGGIRSKRKRPAASVALQRPGLGHRHPGVRHRLAGGVAQRAAEAVQLGQRARRAVGDPRAHRLRPHLGPALSASRRTRRRGGRRSRSTPCTGRRPRSRSRPSPRAGGRPRSRPSARPSAEPKLPSASTSAGRRR